MVKSFDEYRKNWAKSKTKEFFDIAELDKLKPIKKYLKIDDKTDGKYYKLNFDYNKARGALIAGFHFKLSEYGTESDPVEKQEFYLIEINKENVNTMGSLRIPKWFLGKSGIKDFLTTLDTNYLTLKKAALQNIKELYRAKEYLTPEQQAIVREQIMAGEYGGI